MSTANQLLRSILDANETYASAFAQADPKLLRKLAKGQAPKILWLGCSDSRVSAELATGVAPGSIFVHRNVANSFNEQDLSAAAALTYAVNVLKVETIIVCGHTGCGGVRAAMEFAAAEHKAGQPAQPSNQHERIVTEWIKPIKDLALSQITTESKEADGSYDPLSVPAIATLTDKHVEETVRALKDSSIVRDAWKEGRELSIYGWVYHVATAKLRDLDIGFTGPDGARAPSLHGQGRLPSSYAASEDSAHLPATEDSDEE